MHKDQVKGVAEKAKGKVNEEIGRAIGDGKQEVKGDAQQAVAEGQKKYRDAKEAIRKQAKQAKKTH
ncbi:CsbD family protein [Burkholderia sp. WTPI3]|uniref:CsbD family protein n=1 Tax=Burkholderia sp. WTPI3 TaxID=2822167 RepID=UPI001F246240|nr:CsbD family protein [Burkholderia sp. WTPI3]